MRARTIALIRSVSMASTNGSLVRVSRPEGAVAVAVAVAGAASGAVCALIGAGDSLSSPAPNRQAKSTTANARIILFKIVASPVNYKKHMRMLVQTPA